MRSLVLLTTAAALMLGGCGGSSDGGDTGSVTVAAMDVAGDVTSFVLDVSSIRLVRETGGETEMLGAPRRIDFAALQDFAEFLAVRDVPAGRYDALEVALDFQNAFCRLADGTDVLLYDEDGQTRLTYEMRLTLRLQSAISIGPGEPAHLILDVDLDESLEELSFPNRYRFRANVRVRTQEQAQVETRLWGTLRSVDDTPADPSFSLELEAGVSTRNRVTLRVCDDTSCSGEGAGGTGTGVVAMLRNAVEERVMVMARFNVQDGRFEAHDIVLGPGGPGGWGADVAIGYVAAFEGGAYDVIGAHLVREGGPEVFGADLVARIDGATTIVRQGEVMEAADIGIGQHVMLSGTLVSGGTEIQCDSVRLLETGIKGTVVKTSLAAPQLILDLARFGPHPIDLFDLAGHGIDPQNYRVLTTLDLSSAEAEDPIECRGFVLGDSAVADFESFEVGITASTSAVLSVTWSLPGTDSPFSGATAFPLPLDLTATEIAEVTTAHGMVTTPLFGAPQITLPAGGPTGAFTVRQGNELTYYAPGDAALWLQDVNARLAAGKLAVRLTGKGEFTDGATQVFVADELAITLRNP